MWKGVVSFGMVSIPVRLYIATESSAKISFRQLCPEHHSPIQYKRWCPRGEHELTFGEVLRGYEIGKDSYVIVDDRDLDNMPLATAHSINIEEFVPTDDIEPGLYFIDPLLSELRKGENAKYVNWAKVDAFRKFGGIRIEDDVVVTERGIQNLTREAFGKV